MTKCDKCNSTNIEITEAIGRSLPPKNYINRGKRISWKGIWEVFKCECGYEWKKLKNNYF